jgi:hypothetical protein
MPHIIMATTAVPDPPVLGSCIITMCGLFLTGTQLMLLE